MVYQQSWSSEPMYQLFDMCVCCDWFEKTLYTNPTGTAHSHFASLFVSFHGTFLCLSHLVTY